MASDTRDVKRRNFSLSLEASKAIDEFASEHDMTKSKVVERAVLEYTGKDAVTRIEGKVDELLAKVDGNTGGTPSSSKSAGEKRKSEQESEFDVAGYDPDEERSEPLALDELKELIKQDEPEINPDHIGEIPNSVSTTVKRDIVAGATRNEANRWVNKDLVKDVIGTVLGDSTHNRKQYLDSVLDQFSRHVNLKFNDGEYQKQNTKAYFPSESSRKERFKDDYDDIIKNIETPIYEGVGVYPDKYEKQRQWLNLSEKKLSLTEYGIATEEEIEQLQQDLLSRRNEVAECLEQLQELGEENGNYRNTFKKDQAIQTLRYDRDKGEKMFEFLYETDYLSSGGDVYRVNTDRIVWED